MIPLVERRIEYASRGDTFRLWYVTDTHLGNRAVNETALYRTIQEIAADPSALWVAGGDKIECINISDKRFDPHEIVSWLALADLSNLAQCQAKRYLKITKPIWDKCLGSLDGNHERKIRTKYHYDVGGYIAAEMGVPYLGEAGAWLRLRFSRRLETGTRATTTTYHVVAHHGWGGGRHPGSAANALRDALATFNADIVMLGHRHLRLRVALAHYVGSGKRVITRTRVGLFGGTFLDGAEYAQRAGYTPSEIGAVCVELTPDKHGIEVRL